MGTYGINGKEFLEGHIHITKDEENYYSFENFLQDFEGDVGGETIVQAWNELNDKYKWDDKIQVVEEPHSLECPDEECPNSKEGSKCKFIDTLTDIHKTEIFFCYKCNNFFGIPDNGDIYTWAGDRGVEANFNQEEEE